MVPYRKIYLKHHGFIPKDNLGRVYDIHHIDGNKKNNNINNLIALSIQEHYDIHLKQNDWGACLALAKRMKVPEKTGLCLACDEPIPQGVFVAQIAESFMKEPNALKQ